MTHLEKQIIERWFENLDYLSEDDHSDLYSLYIRLMEKGHNHPDGIMMILEEEREAIVRANPEYRHNGP